MVGSSPSTTFRQQELRAEIRRAAARLLRDAPCGLAHETAFHYADWHSLLTVVKAVVSPGRPSHHLAQVARECGVPLVGHVTGDLDAVPEGATIEVDGSSGLVRVG